MTIIFGILSIMLALAILIIIAAIIATPFIAISSLFNDEFDTKEEFYNNLFIWRVIKTKLRNLK